MSASGSEWQAALFIDTAIAGDARLVVRALAGSPLCVVVVDLRGADCDCRAPRPGALWRAARELRLDLARSWMVADTLDGIEAGRRAGCRTILVDNGVEERWNLSPIRTPHCCVAGPAAIAAIVMPRPAADDDDFDAEPAWSL
jgi:phosphoglycolate phosphatase-like HAD superfamily hydrolase